MAETFIFTKSMLVKLFDGLGYPNPDDPGDPNNPWGPYGPHGPIIHGWGWAWLNPQPLPPREGGPQPEPWRAGLFARMVIDRMAMHYKFGELVTGREFSDRTIESLRAQLYDDVNDWCGTVPKKWPFPGPRPPKFDNPLELLFAGAEFQRVADSFPDNPLQADFAAAADQLIQTGLERLEKGETRR